MSRESVQSHRLPASEPGSIQPDRSNLTPFLWKNHEGPPRPSISGGMSRTSRQATKGSQDRTERVHRSMAVLVTALLHMLLVLVMLQDPPITVTTPQAEAGGSAMNVTLIDETLPPSPPEPVPPVHKPVLPKKPKAPRAIKRPLSTPVVQGTVPMPPEAADMADTSNVPPDTTPEPPDAPRDTAEADRPVHVYGQPPGMRRDDAASANAALAAKLGSNRGHSNNALPDGSNMGVDGFHVYYDLANEIRLRAWREQGMTELFLPMPGTRRLMVCPLEVALRRGSSACRMVDEDSPELTSIGDAREVIKVQRVYQLGDMVWDGPGPYR
jgi:hypothetical protein